MIGARYFNAALGLSLGITAICIAMLCSPGNAIGDEWAGLRLLGSDFPAKVNAFDRGRVTNFERQHPGLGYAIAYHGPGREEATVYVYDLGLSLIPEGPLNDAVKQAFGQASNDVAASYSTVELVGRYSTGSTRAGVEFLCAEFLITKSGLSKRSFLYLTGHNSKFVKIRVTLGTSDPTVATARKFADEIASVLWPNRQQ